MSIPAFRRTALSLFLVPLLLFGPLSLRAQNIDYTKGSPWAPNLLAPYSPRFVPRPELLNSPRLEDLIRDGKLFLSLQDTIYLALENNLDMAVQRFNLDIAETDVLRARGGGITRGAGGFGTVSAVGVGQRAALDPVVTSNLSWQRTEFPVNNPLISGTGATLGEVQRFTQQVSTANFSYTQGFMTGTSFTIALNNQRASDSSLFSFFNPRTTSQLQFSFTQPLLNGFGYAQNKRFILVSKNNLEISNQAFVQQVMDIISQVKNAYWELVFARADVQVKEESLALAQRLYENNKRQVEIGTLAPIEVVRAESEVARNRQDLIIAQTRLLQQQIVLKDLIAKDTTDPLLAVVEIVPTNQPDVPDVPEILPVQDAISIAMEKRPEIAQAQLDIQNRNLAVRGARNAMLPTVNAFGFFNSRGLSGEATILSNPVITPGTPIILADGTPAVDPVSGQPLFVQSATFQDAAFINRGAGTSLTQALQGDFPDYGFGVSITIPIKNRVAQAEMARAQIEQRQSQVRYQRQVNTIIVDVRNAQIALEQNRARIDAARQASRLAEETWRAEQKKFQLGASTIFQVIRTQRDLSDARSQEIRALVDFARAQVEFDRALGRTLERSNVNLEDAQTGVITAGAPGTPGRPPF
ncbi:MAG: TolC family protein [Candidatus Acidoferrales bacterium]